MAPGIAAPRMLPLRQHAGQQTMRERVPLGDLGLPPSLEPLKFPCATLSKPDGANGGHVHSEPFIVIVFVVGMKDGRLASSQSAAVTTAETSTTAIAGNTIAADASFLPVMQNMAPMKPMPANSWPATVQRN